MGKIDSIKLQYFLNWFTEFNSLIEAKLRSGLQWPLEIDIDLDTSILISKEEWDKTKEANNYYTGE